MNWPTIIEITSDELGARKVTVRWSRLAMVLLGLGSITWLFGALAVWLFVSKFHDFPEVKFTDLVLPSRWANYRATQGDHYIAQAEQFVAKNDYISAFTKLRAGVAKSPGNSHGRILLAQFYTANRRPDLAQDILLGGIARLQHDPVYLRDVLRFLLDFKEDAKLLAVARELLRSDTISTEEKRPVAFFAALAGMVVCYLALIEGGKRLFYGAAAGPAPTRRAYSRHRHLRRRAAYFSTDAPVS